MDVECPTMINYEWMIGHGCGIPNNDIQQHHSPPILLGVSL